jgi:hypothetical protein
MHARLEEYVEEIGRRLRSLPAEEREREIAEIKLHLEQMAAGQREAGLSEDEAITAAIRQFGSAKSVGSGLQRTWRRGLPFRRDSLPVALLLALVVPYCLGNALHAIETAFFANYVNAWGHMVFDKNGQATFGITYLCTSVLISMLKGSITAMVAPKHSKKALILSFAIMSIAGIVGWLSLASYYITPEGIARSLAFSLLSSTIHFGIAFASAHFVAQRKEQCLVKA